MDERFQADLSFDAVLRIPIKTNKRSLAVIGSPGYRVVFTVTPECLLLKEFLELYCQNNCRLPLALNIKADRLQVPLQSLLIDFGVENYFVFDMSIPDTLEYLKKKFCVFSRQSEYEPNPCFYQDVSGIWANYFQQEWFDKSVVLNHIKYRKKVCFVSPELHGRMHLPLWSQLKNLPVIKTDYLMLCTDYPNQAREYFYGES
jgi:hypothetical protein